MRRLVCCGLAALLLPTGAGGYLRAQGTPPTPESVIGFSPCSDYSLATSE